jgi:hypothetical protein
MSYRQLAQFKPWLVATAIAVALMASVLQADGGRFRTSPHGSPTSGVNYSNQYPTGSCAQCHHSHDPSSPYPFGLFRENSNDLCLTASQGGCHADQPAGASSGYPAQESDRMPNGSSDPGYFEYNNAGTRVAGLANLVRWPGQQVWQDLNHSPHNSSPNMPIKDAFGNGSCDNCHNVHGGPSEHDMLDTTYLGISGSQNGLVADNYKLCLSCHSPYGPVGMADSSKHISEYYDRAMNPNQRSGHGVSSASGYIPGNSRLPCYDCHNPHGSQGYDRLGPNAYLLSDQRTGWWGLDSIKTDTAQVRRFCFGCHKTSDGLRGGTVEGMTMPPLTNLIPEHASTSSRHCYDCHGRDYSSGTSHNVHNPAIGNETENLLQ